MRSFLFSGGDFRSLLSLRQPAGLACPGALRTPDEGYRISSVRPRRPRPRSCHSSGSPAPSKRLTSRRLDKPVSPPLGIQEDPGDLPRGALSARRFRITSLSTLRVDFNRREGVSPAVRGSIWGIARLRRLRRDFVVVPGCPRSWRRESNRVHSRLNWGVYRGRGRAKLRAGGGRGHPGGSPCRVIPRTRVGLMKSRDSPRLAGENHRDRWRTAAGRGRCCMRAWSASGTRWNVGGFHWMRSEYSLLETLSE